jgi:3-methyladenine DNA glycosylase AlkD
MATDTCLKTTIFKIKYMPQNYLNPLIAAFDNAANAEQAVPMAKYMKNKFVFWGIPAPERRKIISEFLKKNGLPDSKNLEKVVKFCLQQPQREIHYFAVELVWLYFQKKIKNEKSKNEKVEEKHLQESDVELLEHIITTNSWWDTVDNLIKSNGFYFKKFPHKTKEVTQKWINSENMWLRRSAIVFQLFHKEDTDETILFDYIQKCISEKEFFIRKAIGWALREYSKTNPEAVIEFVENNPQLSNLSRREALRWLSRPQKKLN